MGAVRASTGCAALQLPVAVAAAQAGGAPSRPPPHLGQEGVEAQNQLREAVEQGLDLLNHAGGVDSARQSVWQGGRVKKPLAREAARRPTGPLGAPMPRLIKRKGACVGAGRAAACSTASAVMQDPPALPRPDSRRRGKTHDWALNCFMISRKLQGGEGGGAGAG